MGEKILITGADGMLGTSMCRIALDKGYKVKAMVLPGRSITILQKLSVEIVEGDVRNIDQLDSAVQGCDFIINVAAITTLWPRRMDIIQNVNYKGVVNLVSVAKKYAIKRMIQIGTANSFDHGPFENPGDETNGFTGGKYKLDYIDSKYQAQQYLLKEFKEQQFPIIVVNPTFMIGPYDSGPTSGKMIMELFKKKLPGYSSGGKNFVCSLDVATAAVNALTLGKEGECYIAGNENLYYEDFLKLACQVRGIKFKLRKVPNLFILIVGIVNSIWARIFRKIPNLSFTIAKLSLSHQFYNVNKARKELQMPATPISEAIEFCIRWWEENDYLEPIKK